MDLSTLTPASTHLDSIENSSDSPATWTSRTPFLDSLARHTSATPYRKELNKITGSVHASIFLEQLIWRWRKAGRKTFSKFISPCAHPDYRPGSSWHEELGFSRREFEGAVKAIGTKITAGKSKRAARQNNVLIYWTDKQRLTHWELNPTVLEARLRTIEEDSDALARMLLRKCPDRTLPSKCTNPALLKNAPTQTTDSANSRGKSNGRQPQKTHDLEALVLEDGSESSSNSLSEHPQTRASEGHSSSQEVTTLSGAMESSGRDSRNLKRQEQKPAPRQGRRESPASTATSKKALAVKDTDLSPAGRETLQAALARQTELKGAANIAHTRRRLLALWGADEPAWIALLEHSTLKARDCVAGFAGTHAARPASAGKSLSDAAYAKKRKINRGGSYSERSAFIEDGAPKGSTPPADDVYTQHGAQIKNGCRPSTRDGGFNPDIRLSADGIRYHLLKGERSPDALASRFVEDGGDKKIHEGLAGLEKERSRRAGAARRREGYEYLFDAEETEATA